MKYQIEMIGLKIFQGITRLLPFRLRYFLADILGSLSFRIIKSRREVTLKNLALAFPEKTQQERMLIAKASYRNMSRNFVETFFMLEIFKRHQAKIINEAVMKENYDQGKGVLLASLHQGNWEVGALFGFQGYKMYHIVKRQKNPLFDRYINDTREAMGVKFVYKGEHPKKLISAIKEGAIISMLSDQFIDDVEVTFFGKTTKAPSGAAVLAIKYGVPIVFGYCFRNENLAHELRLVEKVDIVIKETLKESVQATTQALIDKMESVIREYPEQWLWQHNRFKEWR